MELNLLKSGIVLLGIVLVLISAVQPRFNHKSTKFACWTLGALVTANIVFNGFLWWQHLYFPLNLDLMEGTILQHFQRAVALEPIYPEPTPAYVSLAYNPLYYIFSTPFAWVFGVKLATLRLVSILGTGGSGLVIYRVIQQKTESYWWGWLSVGLFAAAYSAMDVYLDTAHADSWLLCSLLLGSYLISRSQSRLWNLAGIVILIAAFWFKQHGALFAIGGLLFLTWRDGMRRSLPYWLIAITLGPILYIFAGAQLFGPRFHYFTWQVPRQWSELNLQNFKRYFKFIINAYPVLAVSSILLVGLTALRKRKHLEIWYFQFIFAILSGFMGTLDHGSSNNVFIPMGTLFILMGVLGLHTLSKQSKLAQRYGLHFLALYITFSIFLYNPQNALISSSAHSNYADLIAVLRNLNGNVYAPSLGQLQSDYSLYPAAHWVALEDMVRGPGIETRNQPLIRHLLDDLIHPNQPTFILSNRPLLELTEATAFLSDYYTLDTDFGDRFEPLRCLVKPFNHGYPRYLYRYTVQKPTTQS